MRGGRRSPASSLRRDVSAGSVGPLLGVAREELLPVGPHTYTVHGVRHTRPLCARLAMGGLDTDPALHGRLTGAGSPDAALRLLEKDPWKALAEQEARELEEALGVKVEVA